MEPQEALHLRSTLRVELVGQAEPILNLDRVPTNVAALKALFYAHKADKLQIPVAIKRVTDLVCSLNIPGVQVAPVHFVKRRILALYNEWKGKSISLKFII